MLNSLYRKKIGLVLSGGGARAIAHLGLLQGLEEIGIKPDIISGVSAGAIIGALYAVGHSPKQIMTVFKEHTSSSLPLMLLSPNGLFRASGLKQLLRATIPTDKFESLAIPLFVTATDIVKGISVTYSNGELHNVLIGSSAVPVLFTPQKHGKQYLVDGGVLNNFPIACIQDKCQIIIGCHVNSFTQRRKKLDRLHVFDQCFHMAISNTVNLNTALCDVLIEPQLAAYSMFDTQHADKIFKIGYQAVIANKKRLLSMAKQALAS